MAGFALLLLGLGWILANQLLERRYPLSWGGPNIGGGFLVLLAWGLIGLGTVALAADLVRRPPGLRRPGRPWWIALTVVVVLLVAGIVVRSVPVSRTVARGGINGQVGLTVSASGALVAVLEICDGSTSELSVLGPNRGSQPNEILARLQAFTPVTGTVRVDIDHPPSGWTAATGLPGPSAGAERLRILSARGDQTELRQVSFVATDLAGLTPGIVLYSVGSTHPARVAESGFRAIACR